MKYVVLFLCVLFLSAHSQAQDRPLGLGVILGEPTGISAKYWTSGSNALAFGLGWSYERAVWVWPNGRYHYTDPRFHFHADYLWHSFGAIRSSERFPLYYGVGARMATGGVEAGSLGVRGVVGIAWLPRSTHLDVFLELAPTLLLVPSTDLSAGAGFGARVFF
jgi:hypothetical protein